MLNNKNIRELAYLVKVNSISEMNADRLELAHIAGWNCVVGKDEFKAGDIAIYFEVDSQLPDKAPWNTMEFLKSKKYKIKTQKIRGEISQGLLVSPRTLGWQIIGDLVIDELGNYHSVGSETRFLTVQLGVTYNTIQDRARKGSPMLRFAVKYPKFAKTKFYKRTVKTKIGKWIFTILGGKKTNNWPTWVKVTDEERCQNLPNLFTEDSERKWIVTEKIDGTSCTFTIKKNRFGKRKFYVCSRRVCFSNTDKKCFYDSNVYWNMAHKYNAQERLNQMFWEAGDEIDFITLQGEIFGKNIQKREYGMEVNDLRIFNVIMGYKDGSVLRLNPIRGKNYCEKYGFKFVPIIKEMYSLPKTCEEMLEYANGTSEIDGGMREGVVLRTYDGAQSFKAVSNSYLLKYHS